MKFGEAIDRAKEGHQISRTGWNGKGMFVFIAVPTKWASKIVVKNPKGKEVSVPLRSCEDDPDEPQVRPCFVMKDAQGMFVFGWLASQTDMLADDWSVVAT